MQGYSGSEYGLINSQVVDSKSQFCRRALLYHIVPYCTLLYPIVPYCALSHVWDPYESTNAYLVLQFQNDIKLL